MELKIQLKQIVAIFALAGSAGGAFAGPAADDARIHFDAIAAGDVALVTRQYADGAMLEWVGGPLDGCYAGVAKIGEVWQQFTKANPGLKVAVASVDESANPKGATVTANIRFDGKQPIHVRYVLTYRDGKLVHETWQIDPKLATVASR